ncbi:MAG: anaerobic ribonucleoside-triphosphate reductase activating protein [Candidatus Omnitrophota bacterium]
MAYQIKGFNPHTFIDWEGKLASVIYLPGCNFRCPFCHTKDLVSGIDALSNIPLEQIERFLDQKKGWIDSVVIGGGEPTLHNDLAQLLTELKNYGLLVKLDTNGTRPDVLKNLLSAKLVDYIAMDVKAPLVKEKYEQVVKAKVDMGAVEESIQILLSGAVKYEFRTTVVPTLLDRRDILQIARTLTGAKRYVLQQFSPKNTLDEAMSDIKPHSFEELKCMAQLANEFVKNCFVRGT